MHVTDDHDQRVLLEDLVREIYALGAVNRELQRRVMPEHPPACLQALAVIARTDAGRVSDVADRLRIDLSVASRQVAVLESSGWVTREPDPADGRARRLVASEAGLAVLGDARARMAGAYAHALAGWSEADLRSLQATLARVREDLARQAEPALAAAGR
jgi:DNA-binding MarR family transcriptional regulator